MLDSVMKFLNRNKDESKNCTTLRDFLIESYKLHTYFQESGYKPSDFVNIMATHLAVCVCATEKEYDFIDDFSKLTKQIVEVIKKMEEEEENAPKDQA